MACIYVVGEFVKLVVVVDTGVVFYRDSIGTSGAVDNGYFLRRETVGRGAWKRRCGRIMRSRGC